MNPLIDYLIFHTKLTPNKVAIEVGGNRVTFLNLFIFVKKFASKLRGLGITSNNLVLTCLGNKDIDWIITLALIHEGALSCSNHGYHLKGNSISPDFVITDTPLPDFPTEQQIVINQAWIKDVLATESTDGMYKKLDENSIVRLVLTSGTTGNPKPVALNSKLIMDRTNDTVINWISGGKALDMYRLSIGGGFISACAALVTGNIFHCPRSIDELITTINDYRIELLMASPLQITGLIEKSNNLKEKGSSIKYVRVGGGAVNHNLISKIKQELSCDVIVSYGSTEAGGVCSYTVPPQVPTQVVAGFPFPGVEIKIVDENDNSLNINEEGLVKIKTKSMVHTYHQDSGETHAFKDGFFYPGDKGYLNKQGILILTGRTNDVINSGGVKVNAQSIEQYALNLPHIKDAAVFPIEKEGSIKIAIAVVKEDGFNISEFQEALLKEFGVSKSPKLVFQVNQIPRNQSGKIIKSELTKLHSKS